MVFQHVQVPRACAQRGPTLAFTLCSPHLSILHILTRIPANYVADLPVHFQNVKLIKDKERLSNSSRFRETQET